MMGYGGSLALLLVAALARVRPPGVLVLAVLLFGFGTAVYSAFLFNQAKGRDLWQSPVLPLHLIAHAVSAGAARARDTNPHPQRNTDAEFSLLSLDTGHFVPNIDQAT